MSDTHTRTSAKESTARYSTFGKKININATESVVSNAGPSREGSTLMAVGSVTGPRLDAIEENQDENMRKSEIKEEFKTLIYNKQPNDDEGDDVSQNEETEFQEK